MLGRISGWTYFHLPSPAVENGPNRGSHIRAKQLPIGGSVPRAHPIEPVASLRNRCLAREREWVSQIVRPQFQASRQHAAVRKFSFPFVHDTGRLERPVVIPKRNGPFEIWDDLPEGRRARWKPPVRDSPVSRRKIAPRDEAHVQPDVRPDMHHSSLKVKSLGETTLSLQPPYGGIPRPKCAFTDHGVINRLRSFYRQVLVSNHTKGPIGTVAHIVTPISPHPTRNHSPYVRGWIEDAATHASDPQVFGWYAHDSRRSGLRV